MAATAGIYWCLVLVDLIVLSSAAILNQTSPSYTPLCPGNELVLTCTTYNTGLTFWKVPQAGLQQSESELIPKFGTVIAGLILNITKKEGTTVTSTGTYQSINESLNGSVVGCSGSSTDIQLFANFTINIRDLDPPIAVNNISINPIDNNTIFIDWLHQNQQNICIDHYKVVVNDSNEPSSQYNYSTTGNNPNITINDFIIGTNYSFIIIPIDTIGREGPPSSLIQYIWNVPAQVDYSTVPVPPIQYYIISVYNTSNSIIYTNNTNDTNITITGLPLTDTNYTVTIIPVNIIGYGPSATVNVTLTTDISTSTPVLYIPSTSISASSTDSSSYTNTVTSSSSTTGFTTAPTTVRSTLTLSTMIPPSTSTASASNAVPIISGAIGTILTEHLKSKISPDAIATPTYDEIIVKPTTTTGVPIYDTPMELQANTAYDHKLLSSHSFYTIMATALVSTGVDLN
uniref:Fibronectin type-III domain-containing protein n=1 Tax=Amphimedon queenslandica TaxID=400682 RepID=A0A1X7TT62_AMPQE